MEQKDIIELVNTKAKEWLNGNYDEDTKKSISDLINKEDKADLIDSFYKDLELKLLKENHMLVV